MKRYNIINEKNKREIVLLRGMGCIYKKCTFCDYYSDSSNNADENYKLNKSVLDKVTGIYGNLEIINSGSVFELDKNTIEYIKKVCRKKAVKTIHFESHYLYKNRLSKLRKDFEEFELKIKLGLETFDYELRENILNKGIKEKNPYEISIGFDEANFLFGIKSQTLESMKNDIELGLKYFERICVNIMCDNSTKVCSDKDVTKIFVKEIYPIYKDDSRIDILLNNTDFGVGD